MSSQTRVDKNSPKHLEELKESERKYRSLFERMTEGFVMGEVVLDGKGEPYDFCFLEVNKAWEKMTHISRKKAIGRTYRELFPQPIEDFIQKHDRVALTGETTSFELYSPYLNLWFSFYVYSPIKGKFASISTDITRRKQAEEALARTKNELEIKIKERTAELAESEEKYRLLIENASEVVMVAQDGLIKFMNHQGIKPTGFLPEEMIDKPFLQFVYPDDRRAVKKEVRRHIEGQPVTSNFEFRFVTKDGIIRWAIMNSVNISWEGKPAILAIITDITERKLAEEKIKNLLGFRTLLTDILSRFVNVPIDRLDQEIQDAQRRLCQYLHLDISSSYLPLPEDPTIMKLAYLFHPSEFPSVPDILKGRDYFPWCEQQLISGKEAVVVPSTRELPPEAARDQASWQHFGIKSSLMFPLLAGEKIVGTLSFDTVREECRWPEELVDGLRMVAQVFANAIARKQFEEALKESEVKANALIQFAPAAIYEIDIQGTRFFSVNDAMSAITGYTREELLTMDPTRLLDEDSRKRFAEMVKRKLTGKRVETEADFRAIRKDGTFIDVTLRVTFSPKNPDIVFVVAHDVTERKKMEDALKTYAWRITQVQEDERKRIGYELHDDTAQYLSILKMQLDALIHSGKIQNREVTEKLEYLEKDAAQAFNDVRRYSHELRPVTLERSGLTAALEQIAEDYNKIGQLPVTIKVGGEEPKLSEEVKLGFFRIAQEALNNARKHSYARQATITISYQENRLKMSVRDDGAGFDVNEAAARASGKGSLGLMSMRERADLIDAILKIESKPGAGTTVNVEKQGSLLEAVPRTAS